MRLWAKIRCEFWFYMAVIAHNAFVRPIPDAVWHLQRPGAWCYQRFMGRSYRIDKKHGLGGWKPDQAPVTEGVSTHP